MGEVGTVLGVGMREAKTITLVVPQEDILPFLKLFLLVQGLLHHRLSLPELLVQWSLVATDKDIQAIVVAQPQGGVGVFLKGAIHLPSCMGQ